MGGGLLLPGGSAGREGQGEAAVHAFQRALSLAITGHEGDRWRTDAGDETRS